MAKKKQLAGKTTKLARLPLTLALAEQAEEGERRASPGPREARSGEPLGAVYLHVIRELTSMLAELPADSAGLASPPRALLPPVIPQPQQLRQILRQARQGLQELQALLFQP